MTVHGYVVFLLALVAVFLAGCCRCAREWQGVGRDPIVERADVVSDEGPGTIPSIGRAPNGDLIVAFNTRGDVLPGAVIKFVRSKNEGRTWSSPYFEIRPGADNVGASINASSILSIKHEGKSTGLMAAFPLFGTWKRPVIEKNFGSRSFDFYLYLSTDNGLTFQREYQLNDATKRHDFAQGNVLALPGGDLIMPWGHWGDTPLNGFRRSGDGGLTWAPVKRAWQDPPPGHDKPLAFNETAVILCKDGSILAIARVDTLLDKKFWMIRSRDNGHSWTTPRQIAIAGGSPALYCTPRGQLWLAYRDGGFGPGLGLAVSDDHGEHWRFLYHLEDATGEHQQMYAHMRYSDEDRSKPWRPKEGIVGYPWFVRLSDSRVYVVFHSHNEELKKKFGAGADPYYIVGNVLTIPD